MSKDIKIIVATHKKYSMPHDALYLPVEVGAAMHEKKTGYQPDNVGKNISKKNPSFCELTGLYWAWKNLKNDYIGLVHYRRYFASKPFLGKNEKERLKSVLSLKEASKILEETDIILPKKRNYIIENLYDHYRHTMYVEPLDMTGEIIKDKYPAYYYEFKELNVRRSAHMFNMMIMKKEILDEYCDWLFDILFELEKRVKKKNLEYSAFHSRFYGRVSELLLDVFIRTKGYEYKEVRVKSIQPVNWIKKGKSFLMAKFKGRKYDKSF